MKKIIYFYLSVCLFFLCPSFVNATIDGLISGDGVRIRSLPDASDDNNILIEATLGYLVKLVDRTTYVGNGCSDGWYKIVYNDFDAYVCSTYVNIVTNPEYITSSWSARTYSNNIFVRNGPGTNYSIQNRLILGNNITVLDYDVSGNGCVNSWVKIKYYDNKNEGYICGDHIVIRNNIIDSDSEYEQTLASLGFPESYFPYLTYLHKKYPNWIFKPVITNLTWNEVIIGETYKNYIQMDSETYKNYNYIIDNSIAEPSNWYYANTGVISFYMDPRNFLNEKYLFMFETLNYDNNLETQYPNIIRQIFGTGALNNDDFISLLNNSGKTYDISPSHLASRIRQEVTVNGNAATSGAQFTWGGVQYSGYYNFFNIGAYGDDPQLRGLAYAAGLIENNNNTREPWNTVEKSINAGSSFLSSNYISKGQYNLYFQKFNTAPNAHHLKYTHQYMTNIQAPSSEAASTYNSLKTNNLLSNAYSFSIPIYKDMPATISLPSSGSKNNYLSSITIDEKALFEFDKDVLEYSFFIDKSITSVNIKGNPENSLSNVSGDGVIEIGNDNKSHIITVTAENGEIRTYKINLTKVDSITSISELDNILGVTNSNIIAKNSINNLISTIITKITSQSPSSLITIKEPDGSISNSSNILKTGQQVIIKTTSNETKTYYLSVIGDTDGDGKISIIDLLRIQKHIMKATTLESYQLVAGDTNEDNEVTILDLLRVQKHILGEINL